MMNNQRLKSLIEEVGFVGYGEDAGFYIVPVPAFLSRMDRLAELIIRECIECAEWVGRMNTTAVEPVNTAHAIVKRIEKQLGVEE